MSNILDFFSFIKGQLFIYAGQEYGDKHKPELFEKDPIGKEVNIDILELYKKAIKNKKASTRYDYQLLEKLSDNKAKVNSYIDDKIVDSKVFEL